MSCVVTHAWLPTLTWQPLQVHLGQSKGRVLLRRARKGCVGMQQVWGTSSLCERRARAAVIKTSPYLPVQSRCMIPSLCFCLPRGAKYYSLVTIKYCIRRPEHQFLPIQNTWEKKMLHSSWKSPSGLLNYFFLNMRSWFFLFMYLFLCVFLYVFLYICIFVQMQLLYTPSSYPWFPPLTEGLSWAATVGMVHCTWPKYSYSNLKGSLSPSCTLMDPLQWQKAKYPIRPQSVTFPCGWLVGGGSSANSACAGIGFCNFCAAFATTCCFFLVCCCGGCLLFVWLFF